MQFTSKGVNRMASEQKNNLTKKIFIVALAASFVISVAVSAASPGGSDDPLISKSYVDSVLTPYIDKASTFTVASLSKGQTLIGDAGCEIILRMGTASVIATSKGGLCDTTLGGDWVSGSDVPSNHNLIVPMSDGRGIKAESDIIILVKGSYTIK
jgi:hypothetical protein